MSLRFHEKFDHFTDRTLTSWSSRYCHRRALHFRTRVCRGDGQSNAPHDHNICQVVADISHLRRIGLSFRQNLLKDRNLFDVSLKDPPHTHLARTFDRRRRIASANYTGFNMKPVQPAESNSILRIEALCLNHPVFAVRHKIEASVGENAIDIHEKDLDARGDVMKLLFGDGRIQLHDKGSGMVDLKSSIGRDVVERVAKIIHRYSMLTTGSRTGVAVSGGADSIALLFLLKSLASRFQTELTVLHVNHQLRGAESDEDEEFVRSVASALRLPFIREKLRPEGGNLEAEARRLRRQFFRDCKRSHGIARIALGHTRSDQAETVLHHVLRGSGTSGMAGMRFSTPDGFVRPLLDISREEVRTWASGEGLQWREDSSNADLRFTRNRLRLETIPALSVTYNQNLEAALAHAAELAQAEEDYWMQLVGKIFAASVKRNRLGLIFQIGDLEKLDLGVRRRLIRRALGEIRSDGVAGIDFSHVEAISNLGKSPHGHDRVTVPGADAIRSFDTLLLTAAGRMASEPRGYRIRLIVGTCHELPHGAGRICISHSEPEPLICGKFKEDQEFIYQRVCLDAKALAERPLLVRNWEPGDELQRSGHKSSEKIKRLFQEKRVLLWERRHWPTIECEGELVWVRDFGVAEKFSLKGKESVGMRLAYGYRAWPEGDPSYESKP
jgi:tRNA(Ile)-lysidine synthase